MDKNKLYNSSIIDDILNNIDPTEAEKVEKRMLLAARIDEALKAKGWKQKDLANKLNKTPSEITKWLSGTHNFTSDTLFDIERVLGITLVKVDDKREETIKTYVYYVSSPVETGINYEKILLEKSNKKVFSISKSFSSKYIN